MRINNYSVLIPSTLSREKRQELYESSTSPDVLPQGSKEVNEGREETQDSRAVNATLNSAADPSPIPDLNFWHPKKMYNFLSQKCALIN